MLAAAGQAQAARHRTPTKAKAKVNVEQRACTDAKTAFIEKFSQVVSTFHDQVGLAKVTPRIALTQRVADLQKTAQELKSTPIPACASVPTDTTAAVLSRDLATMKIDIAATFAIPNDTTGPAAESMKEAVRELQSSDEAIEATCQKLPTEKAQNVRLHVWKADANSAAKFEIARFLLFMRTGSSEKGSFEEQQAAVASALYSLAARMFWRTTPTGRELQAIP